MLVGSKIDQRDLIETGRIIWSFDVMREKSPRV